MEQNGERNVLDRLSLSKRRSQRNFNDHDRNEQQPGSSAMARGEEAKDWEIRELNEQIRNLETERVISHHVQEPKNAHPVQRIVTDQNASEINEIDEMKTYLAGVMDVIVKFEKQLSTRPGTCPTRVDRS